MHALGLAFGSAAQLSKRPGSVWNCLWGNALKRSPGIIRKSRVSYPGPGFLSSATWPMLPKKHYNGLNQTKPKIGNQIHSDSHASLPLQTTGFPYNAFGSPTRMHDKNIFKCTRALCFVSVVLNALVNRDSVQTLKYIFFAQTMKSPLAIHSR